MAAVVIPHFERELLAAVGARGRDANKRSASRSLRWLAPTLKTLAASATAPSRHAMSARLSAERGTSEEFDIESTFQRDQRRC
jgi:hypothetical protein